MIRTIEIQQPTKLLTRKVLLVLFLLVSTGASAQQILTLDECHRRALENNKGLKQAEEKVAETQALKKMAIAEFFPKATANGTYIWNEKNIQLLSDEQQDKLNNMGNLVVNDLQGMNALTQAIATMFPSLARQLEDAIGITNIANTLNGIGNEITQSTTLDVQNLFAGAFTVYQPVYLGGKLRAVYHAASVANDMATLQLNKAQEDLLIEVDEAYWRVVSLQEKQRLAEQYRTLLAHLDSNVNIMLKEEVATRSDATKVRVKLNEAEMTLAKATNGLTLSKMLLYQICGMDLKSDYLFVEDTNLVAYAPMEGFDLSTVYDNRTEIKMLANAEKLAQSAVKIATSGLLPNVAVQGSYIVTNPSCFNGFENKTAGMFSAGVVVNVPIAHATAFYSRKAAKHKANAVHYQMDEAKEKIELQLNKLNFELDVACKKLAQAQSNLANAEENLRLATESFEAGVIESSDLMGAQTAWQSAKSEVIEAEIEIRMCHLYLQQALGK